MTPKKKFESPLSKYIRLKCSQCDNWGETCGLTQTGIEYMRLCLALRGYFYLLSKLKAIEK